MFAQFTNALRNAGQDAQRRRQFETEQGMRELQLGQAQRAESDYQGLRNVLDINAAPLGGVAPPGVPEAPGGLSATPAPTSNPATADRVELEYWSTKDPTRASLVLERIGKQAENITKATGDPEQGVAYMAEATGKPLTFQGVKGSLIQIKNEETGQTHMIQYTPPTGTRQGSVAELGVVGGKKDKPMMSVGENQRVFDPNTGKVVLEDGVTEEVPVRIVDLGDKVQIYYKNKPRETLPKKQSPNAVIMANANRDNRQFRNEDSLRKEFLNLPEVKDRAIVEKNLGRINQIMEEAKTSKNLVVVDQGLITIFNKMIDEQSVVRESEYARTPQDLALLNRIRGGWEKISTGGAGLTPDDRMAINRMIIRFGDASERLYTRQVEHFRWLAADYGFDPDRIVRLGSKNEGKVGQAAGPTLKVGDVYKGHEYLGGDKSKPESWRKK